MRKKITRAAGAGRKPLDQGGSNLVPVRIPSDLLRAIERLAKEHGHSRSGVIRAALTHWVRRYHVHTLHTEALSCAIALLADEIERRTGKKWISDAATGVALRKQVERLIFHFAPTPAKPVSPDAEVVPPEADVVGVIITLIEGAVPVEDKNMPPPLAFSDDWLSVILRALARQPPHGLGSGWRRNRAVWQGKAKS